MGPGSSTAKANNNGFNVSEMTRSQLQNIHTRELGSSATFRLLRTHNEWSGMEFLDVPQMPIYYQAIRHPSTDWTRAELDVGVPQFSRNDLGEALNSLGSNHDFALDVVPTNGEDMAVGDKIFFMYDNKAWKDDKMSTDRFLDLVEFFTRTELRGAFIKEAERDGGELVPLALEGFSDVMHQSVTMRSHYKAPRELTEICQAAAHGHHLQYEQQGTAGGDKGRKDPLAFPPEMRVLVLWGKAYMTVCNSQLCNPLTSTDDLKRPRYIAYPDGKRFFEPEVKFSALAKNELACMTALEGYLKPVLPKIEAAAERVATALGASWLRVDFLVPEKGSPGARDGYVLHALSTISQSTAQWAGRSQRSSGIVALGFMSRVQEQEDAMKAKEFAAAAKRMKVAAPQESTWKAEVAPPPVLDAGKVLRKLGCEVVEPGPPAAQTTSQVPGRNYWGTSSGSLTMMRPRLAPPARCIGPKLRRKKEMQMKMKEKLMAKEHD